MMGNSFLFGRIKDGRMGKFCSWSGVYWVFGLKLTFFLKLSLRYGKAVAIFARHLDIIWSREERLLKICGYRALSYAWCA